MEISKLGANILNDGNSLDLKTGDWKNRRPVHLKDKCKNCMMCVPTCPENCIKHKDSIHYGFDYDYCKGCGVCARACPFKAIEMEDEI